MFNRVVLGTIVGVNNNGGSVGNGIGEHVGNGVNEGTDVALLEGWGDVARTKGVLLWVDGA